MTEMFRRLRNAFMRRSQDPIGQNPHLHELLGRYWSPQAQLGQEVGILRRTRLSTGSGPILDANPGSPTYGQMYFHPGIDEPGAPNRILYT